MIIGDELPDEKKAAIAQCSECTIRRHRVNVECFNSTRAPHKRSGRPSTITPEMLTALREDLLSKPTQDYDDMILFLLDEFGQILSRWTLKRALQSIKWTRKVVRYIAKQRNADLADYFRHIRSEFPS